MSDEIDPTRWEPPPLGEILQDLGEVDLSRWSEPQDLGEFLADPISLDLDAPPRPPKRRRAPGARQAAAILDAVARETRGASHPSARFDNARILNALDAAAKALRAGEDWRGAVAQIYAK